AIVEEIQLDEGQLEARVRPALRAEIDAEVAHRTAVGNDDVERLCEARAHPLLADAAEEDDERLHLLQALMEDVGVAPRVVVLRIEEGLHVAREQALASVEGERLVLEVRVE